MSLVVPRTVTVVEPDAAAEPNRRSVPLADFRSARAYVLLGDPGAGKSTAFRTEADSDPDGVLVTARQFIERSLAHHPEWSARTLYIDALDEMRAGSPDARRPLDRILQRLERLDRPDFRLSCRAADWLGRNDLDEIVAAARYEHVRLLQLEPLSDGPVLEILDDLGVSQPSRFAAKARDHGLEAMLNNPLLLHLLVKATQDDEWPDSRLGTLKLACRKLARERSRKHRAARRSTPSIPVDQIMDAAGHLSALLLLSDREYVSLDESEDMEALCPEDISDGDQPAILRALKSNLFAGGTDGCFVPVHRQLAEFLAARFLHDRLTSGPRVPASRVFALMTGEDGVVVTQLRGLSAWLAAFDKDSRRHLIESDPIGISLYGDVSAFHRDELEDLLHALAKRREEIWPWFRAPVALRSLIRRDSLRLLGRYLSEENRSEGRQAVVGLLLRALSHAERSRPCMDSVESAARDATWQPWVRRSALNALIHHSGDRRARRLIALLDDLRQEEVPDDDRELQGMLLNSLYPARVGPARIWDYWEPQSVYSGGSRFREFWHHHLAKATNAQDAVNLLQSLAEQGSRFRKQFLDDHGLLRVVEELLYRVLSAVGEQTATETVYDWLEAINFLEPLAGQARRNSQVRLSRWIADRPGVQKRLALEGLYRLWDPDPRRPGEDPGTHDDRTYRAWHMRWAIFEAGEPDGFAEWCLQKAVDAAESRVEVAVELLAWSRPWHGDDLGRGLSIDEVRAATNGIPALIREVSPLLRGQKESEVARRPSEEQSEHRRKQRREQAEFITYVRENAAELRAGTCGARLLHHIAVSYHDFFFKDRDSRPRQRIARLLAEHRDLTDAAIEGFRRVMERDDLPTLRDVIRLDEEGKVSLLALPLLAGLDDTPGLLESLGAPEIARAAALYLLTPLNVGAHPKWYLRALESHSDSVVEALVKVTRSRIRRRQDCLYLWRLPREKAYRAVARRAALSLLRAFPTRCTDPQVSALNEILLAAIRWEVEGLEESVDRRLAKADLDVAQRALLLASGLFLSPERYLPHLVRFLEGGEEARSRHVVRFLAPSDMGRLPMPWKSETLEKLIGLLGARYTPWRPESFGMAGIVEEDRMKVESLLAGWANTLAARTDRDACVALQALVDDPALEPWYILLKEKRDEQVLARRSATFTVPDLTAVQKTLANQEPANASDLAALVAEALEMLAILIRGDNTDGWKDYWNEDARGGAVRPKHEESCRNALLRALRTRLPAGVDAQLEPHYARKKRADIRVSFDRKAIAIEIKKASHRHLWSAATDQLEAQYASAPESSGHGIYLVLWFGGADMPVPPSGRRPKTPDELRARLEAQLAGPSSHRVRVIVMDVSGAPPPVPSGH